eukprot:TRINITY_DN56180_c0_g1_i1.p1 TRINITY_DN56180_c0_g1~~TRINITY_DN56180_c0_g1_i1.p1  ORF type:complete len:333 (+),score=52.77 TRINITY_DN56180_c0_g1_i1:111-1109(+)
MAHESENPDGPEAEEFLWSLGVGEGLPKWLKDLRSEERKAGVHQGPRRSTCKHADSLGSNLRRGSGSDSCPKPKAVGDTVKWSDTSAGYSALATPAVGCVAASAPPAAYIDGLTASTPSTCSGGAATRGVDGTQSASRHTSVPSAVPAATMPPRWSSCDVEMPGGGAGERMCDALPARSSSTSQHAAPGAVGSTSAAFEPRSTRVESADVTLATTATLASGVPSVAFVTPARAAATQPSTPCGQAAADMFPQGRRRRVFDMNLKDWLMGMDESGFLVQYHEPIASKLSSSVDDIVDTFWKDGKVDHRFFDSVCVKKLGHRRLFERWFRDNCS